MTTPRRNRVDLHTHTIRSDGVLEPEMLYQEMRAYGMRLVAISDHDTLAGYRELRAAGLGADASAEGPLLIAAVEINTLAWSAFARHGLGRNGEELHILGYGVDPDDATFEARLARQRDGRRTRMAEMLERLRSLGLGVDDHLDGTDRLGDGSELSAGRPTIARALIAAGHAATVDEAFERYLDHGAPAYVARAGMGPRAAIETITEARGMAVLAHSPEAAERPEIIAELMSWGLAGLEVHYRTFPPETVGRLTAFASSRGLLATGGSDYHGDEMTYATSQAETWVPGSVGRDLLEAIGLRSGAA